MSEPFLTRYMLPLLAGRRAECFRLVQDALVDGWDAERILRDVVWPSAGQIERLFEDDRINIASEHIAARINRTVADQVQAHLKQNPPNGKSIILCCADTEQEELGAQMMADLFQSDGWDVYFLGGGVPNDEILALVGRINPHILLVFGTEPTGVPGVRKLVELIRNIGVAQSMNILVSGGIYNRADGLWQEVGADLFAPTAGEALDMANAAEPRKAQPIPLGVVKKRRRRRRSAESPRPETTLAPT